MTDKINAFYDNHKWFRIFCYIFEFLIYTCGLFIVFMFSYHILNYIVPINGELSYYNTNDVLCIGAGVCVFDIMCEIGEYFKRVYNRIANRNKIDN